MFYEGDLQTGIAEAVQQQKLVVCFIRADNEMCVEWESSYLQQAQVRRILDAAAIVFKIQGGSAEAEMLSAFCPITSTPQLVVIKNGTLKAKINAAASSDDFAADFLRAVDSEPVMENFPPPSSNHNDHVETAERPAQDPVDSTGPAPTSSTTNARVQAMLQERRRRLEAEKAVKEKAEKAQRQAAAASLREEVESAQPNSQRSNRAQYAQLERDRKKAASDERERILKVIENDKIERRERDRLQKEAAQAQRMDESEVPTERLEKVKPTRSAGSEECALKVRMFDGNTILSRFSANDTIEDVRSWIDNESEGDVPFTLKQVLTPLPNRQITISEEKETLGSLGLVPSATLVKIPVQGFATAQPPRSGYVAALYDVCYDFILFMVGVFTHFKDAAFGPQRNSEPERTARSEDESKKARSRNVRTFQDEKKPKDEQQFYNGNQLNFEPKENDDGDPP